MVQDDEVIAEMELVNEFQPDNSGPVRKHFYVFTPDKHDGEPQMSAFHNVASAEYWIESLTNGRANGIPYTGRIEKMTGYDPCNLVCRCISWELGED